MLSELFLFCMQVSHLYRVATLSSLTLIFLLLCIDKGYNSSDHHCSERIENTAIGTNEAQAGSAQQRGHPAVP